ncbi:MAG: hypothetical protein IH987_18340 [Planctomycetes bacterium]|nr:hypothetical protein [Planctomycetota bacterium]
MSTFSGISDEKRSHTGLVFLVAGTLLVVWAWGSWVFRTAENPEALVEGGNTGAAPESTGGILAAGVGIAALAAFSLVGYLFVRRSRRRDETRDLQNAFSDSSRHRRFPKDRTTDSE